jgi:hypothetical protein
MGADLGRRTVAGVAGVLAGIALVRFLRRRAASSVPDSDPADTLRAKLDESRAVAADRDEFEAGETPVDEAADPDARRHSVHEQARAQLDELSTPEGG